MRKHTVTVVLLTMLAGAPAWAQQQEDRDPALRGLVLSLQQIGVSAEQYIRDVRSQLAAKDARIAELLKLCGEVCSPTAEKRVGD